jgi:uncharacterized integral membrane protein (TIGR00698 family)
VIGVTTLSTVAMVLYPILAHWLAFSAADSGRFIGGTIHDVAQVVGAGYAISPQAGDVATMTKLVRVAMLLPTLLLVAWLVRTNEGPVATRTPLLPWFAVAFAVLVLVNSTGWVPKGVQQAASVFSQGALVVAIAALGVKTSLKDIVSLGWRPVLMLVLVTAWLAALMVAYLKLLA